MRGWKKRRQRVNPGSEREILRRHRRRLGAHNAGTIFEITTEGEFRTLHSFNRIDGATPNTLIQATNANLYGTTFGGGIGNSGVIYELTPGGEFRVLYNFCSRVNCADGASPYAPLMEGSDGNFYGTTTFGGASQINQML